MKKIAIALIAICISLTSFANNQTKEVRVKTARQFIEALATDTHIIVENDILDLTQEINKMKADGSLQKKTEDVSGVFYTDEFDGPSLIISRVMNLTIEGKKPNTHIQVTPRYANVLGFIYCMDIKVKNLKLGHTDAGNCIGDVINLAFCQDVTISDCKLYGCGIVGVNMTKCDDVSIKNSEIYECSQRFIYASGVKELTVENCNIHDNGGGLYVEESDDVKFEKCTIKNNHGELYGCYSRVNMNNCNIDHREGPGKDNLVETFGGKVVINYDNAGELPDYSEDDTPYAFSREKYSHNYDDLRYWEDVLYFTDEEHDFYCNDPWGNASTYVSDNADNEQIIAELNHYLLAEPQDFKANELTQYKKVKSFRPTPSEIVADAIVPCRFQREDNTMNFDKLGGADRKWGVLFRKDDRHVMFAGCWYKAGAKKTFFNDKGHLANGMLKKTADNKFILMFKNNDGNYEFYLFEK